MKEKLKNFLNIFKTKKGIAIATGSVALVAAIVCAVVFWPKAESGNDKFKISESSESEEEVIDVEEFEIEDSSEAQTSSEATTSENATSSEATGDVTSKEQVVASKTQTSTTTSKSNTTTSVNTTPNVTTQTSAPQQSTTNNTTSINPVTGSTWSGDVNELDPSWTCPEPSAHASIPKVNCINCEMHTVLISEHAANLKAEENEVSTPHPNGILISQFDKDKPENQDGNHYWGSIATGAIEYYVFDLSTKTWILWTP